MSKGPGLFSDIGKKARDLLTKDYSADQKFSFSTLSTDGVAGTATVLKSGEQSAADVAALYKYKNALFNVKVDTASNIFTTATFVDIVPSTMTTIAFKVPDFNSGKVEVQYCHDHATLTTATALNKTPLVDASLTVGTQNFVVGAEAGYDTTAGNFTKYTTGVGITKQDACASLILADKGDTLRFSYVYYLDPLKRTAAGVEASRRFSTNENNFTFGGSYAVDNQTLVKAKINNQGTLGALLQHEIIPKSLVTVSGEFDTKNLDKNPRIGIALALKP